MGLKQFSSFLTMESLDIDLSKFFLSMVTSSIATLIPRVYNICDQKSTMFVQITPS